MEIKYIGGADPEMVLLDAQYQEVTVSDVDTDMYHCV